MAKVSTGSCRIRISKDRGASKTTRGKLVPKTVELTHAHARRQALMSQRSPVHAAPRGPSSVALVTLTSRGRLDSGGRRSRGAGAIGAVRRRVTGRERARTERKADSGITTASSPPRTAANRPRCRCRRQPDTGQRFQSAEIRIQASGFAAAHASPVAPSGSQLSEATCRRSVLTCSQMRSCSPRSSSSRAVFGASWR